MILVTQFQRKHKISYRFITDLLHQESVMTLLTCPLSGQDLIVALLQEEFEMTLLIFPLRGQDRIIETLVAGGFEMTLLTSPLPDQEVKETLL